MDYSFKEKDINPRIGMGKAINTVVVSKGILATIVNEVVKPFSLVENLTDGITAAAVAVTVLVTHVIPAKPFPIVISVIEANANLDYVEPVMFTFVVKVVLMAISVVAKHPKIR